MSLQKMLQMFVTKTLKNNAQYTNFKSDIVDVKILISMLLHLGIAGAIRSLYRLLSPTEVIIFQITLRETKLIP